MDLLEYQAKELFRQQGIPVLPSQRIDRPTELKGLTIPFPVVLKSQVYTSARGKMGGIRFVENTIDAIAAAQAIFHLPIMGKYPKVLLAEAKYNAEREFYIAVALDSATRRPVLLGSQFGGVEVEAKLSKISQVVVTQEFSPYYARRLALKMGLEGKLLSAVTDIVEKMYRLFTERDLDLVEINPLAVSSNQELMALDGKIVVNDAAIGRQPELASLVATIPDQAVPHALTCSINLVEREGNIGVLCNGAGLTMATLDLLQKSKGKAANFVDLGGDYRHCCPPSVLQDRLKQAFDLITQEKSVKVVLVNILGGVASCLQVAEAIAGFLKWQSGQQVPFVVRLAGDQFHSARGLLAAMDVPVFESIDEAVLEAVKRSAAPATQSVSPPHGASQPAQTGNSPLILASA
ncbi:MAG: succinate--CoA ligase subunit beta [Pegethrix bostrychoides GSE-TBD4-15B]|jgi:succinyl-CoA synthetase beta subunit|uniref:Succinate--CoA ligase subunit beta n=1 Tax=Pegethrix bostrychoides GSE-TBD4-15B TaxID=2839662 RepID=A0A951PFX0_9CYAN|nr:succinate--CoA ligase subunit beta [Pegethrix bostrychoides GSE-TBD4-15B]